MALVVPKFEVIYKEMLGDNNTLPWITEITISISYFTIRWFVLFAILPITLIFTSLKTPREPLNAISIGLVAVLMLFGFFALFALFTPLIITVTEMQT